MESRPSTPPRYLRGANYQPDRFAIHRMAAYVRPMPSIPIELAPAVAREVPVGSGCTALSISRERRHELVAEGYPTCVVNRAIGLAVIESSAGDIITVLRPSSR
jgi:hypothetical protein